jgi:hypothetical protein
MIMRSLCLLKYFLYSGAGEHSTVHFNGIEAVAVYSVVSEDLSVQNSNFLRGINWTSYHFKCLILGKRSLKVFKKNGSLGEK